MRRLGIRSGVGLGALVGMLVVQAACGDDDGGDDLATVDSSVLPADGGPAARPDGALVPIDGGRSDLDASTTSDTPAQADAGPTIAILPRVLSLTGCDELDVPPLCTVTQEAQSISANCGGALYTGSIAANRAVTLSAAPTRNSEGASVTLACSGTLQASGSLTLDCKQSTTAVGATPASEATCKLASDPLIQPGVTCMELPAKLDDVIVCAEGAAAGGTTLKAGSCQVTQDGCAFQAECAGGVVLAGTVSKTGLRFQRELVALADAQTPVTGTPPVPGKPAFLRGAQVNHTCTGTVVDGALTGSCVAGATRGTMPTSTCTLAGRGTAPTSCELVAPATEQLFVLDSCDALKNGQGANVGIGEPVCAFRQTGCIWEVQCGRGDATKFSGRLQPGANKVEWKLATGTPCELSFDASGAASGKCSVPGQAACELKSKPAVPGGACEVLPGGTNVKSHGCGGGDPLACRLTLQHQCNYMSICGFTASAPDNVLAGEVSVKAGRPHYEFDGLGNYVCSVDKATAAEVAAGDRAPYEWYGQCVAPDGGMCRDNYDPVAKTGFRGLRVYFDVPAGVKVPPVLTPVAPTP